ncbi:MAG TPA: hypothetical protein VLJ41_13145 [Segetibacter sp.]|nr:hypothetical protein [Segetibacter sp.]
MKKGITVLLIVISSSVFSQTNKKADTAISSSPTKSSSNIPATNRQIGSDVLPPRETATDRYLKGPQRGSRGKSAGNTSPFVTGVRAGTNAANSYDSIPASRNNITGQTHSSTIVGGNDTTFNINTISQGGVTTNSGAVDRSGQAQFGQTNWGSSRSTVGEGQWTVPPPITASFNQEFAGSNSATWTRNNVDTNVYSAKYKAGAQWVTTNYNSSGKRLDMRTQYPLVQAPRPVSVYMAKQPASFEVAAIYKIQVQGRPDVYEVETASGKKIYINNDGMEVNY